MVDSMAPLVDPSLTPQPALPEQPRVTPPLAPTVSAPPAQSSPAVHIEAGKQAAVSPDDQLAGFGARFLASSVDGIIIAAISFILMIPVVIIVEPSTTMSGGQLLFQGLGWILMIGSYVYYVYFIARGQTLGKKALKIRVVRAENGELPGYTKAFLREVVGKMVSAMAFGLGYLWMLWDGKKQTWHDKIAGTVVVKA